MHNNDYLGIRIDEQIQNTIIAGRFDSIMPLITQGWETTKNPSFKVYELLYNKKEKEAIKYQKDHVMARHNAITLHICHKNNLENAFDQTLKRCITTHTKKELLKETLILSCQIPDLGLAKKIIALSPTIIDPKDESIESTGIKALQAATYSQNEELVKLLCKNGVKPNGGKDNALKIAIELENANLIEYFLKTSDLKNIDYFYLDSQVGQKGKVKSFLTLFKRGDLYLEGNNNQLLKSLYKALKELKPNSYKKEINQVLFAYPEELLENLKIQKNKELSSLASNELRRRRAIEVSNEINKTFSNELAI